MWADFERVLVLFPCERRGRNPERARGRARSACGAKRHGLAEGKATESLSRSRWIAYCSGSSRPRWLMSVDGERCVFGFSPSLVLVLYFGLFASSSSCWLFVSMTSYVGTSIRTHTSPSEGVGSCVLNGSVDRSCSSSRGTERKGAGLSLSSRER